MSSTVNVTKMENRRDKFFQVLFYDNDRVAPDKLQNIKKCVIITLFIYPNKAIHVEGSLIAPVLVD